MSRRQHDGLSDLRRAAARRKADAWKLLLLGGCEHTRGAVYLGGYAVECKLKAVAMEIFGCHSLTELGRRLHLPDRDIYTHGLEASGQRLPIWKRFKGDHRVWGDFVGAVNHWRPHWRYNPYQPRLDEARAFLNSVDRVYLWLDKNRG